MVPSNHLLIIPESGISRLFSSIARLRPPWLTFSLDPVSWIPYKVHTKYKKINISDAPAKRLRMFVLSWAFAGMALNAKTPTRRTHGYRKYL
jgi:hypothetical protein